MEKIYMTDIREELKNRNNPIVLYGTGNGADRLIDDLNAHKIAISGIFTSGGFVRKRTFRGFEVLSFEELYERFPDMTVLMCFGSDRREVRENIDRISSRVELLFPEYPVYGDNIFTREFFEKHRGELEFVRSRLADRLSRDTFDDVINFRFSGKLNYLFSCESDDVPGPENTNGAVFLDLGAYNGDTALSFAEKYPDYGEIIAAEPDKRSFKKLVSNTAELKNTRCINAAAGDVDGTVFADDKKGRGTHAGSGSTEICSFTVDRLFEGENRPIIIKVDIEGSELEFIHGAESVIRNKKPALKIACYHRSEDLFTLPRAVLDIRDDYKLFMRHKNGVPSWNTDFYFI